MKKSICATPSRMFGLMLCLLPSALMAGEAELWQAADARNAEAPVFAHALSETDARLQRIAALSLGRIGGDGVVMRLQPLLRHASPDVREMAWFALGISGSEKAGAILQEAWRTQAPAGRLYHTAIMAMGNTATAEIQQWLIEQELPHLMSEKRDDDLASALQAIGLMWSYRRAQTNGVSAKGIATLQRLLSEKNNDRIKSQAAFALSRARSETTLFDTEVLHDLFPAALPSRARFFLTRTYGAQLGGAQQSPPKNSGVVNDLQMLALRDADLWVRTEAAFGLGRDADYTRAWQHRTAFLDKADSWTRIAYWQALSERSDLVNENRAQWQQWLQQASAQKNAAEQYSVQRIMQVDADEEDEMSSAKATPDFARVKTALGARYRVNTTRGDIVIRLRDDTPYTSFNFAELADKGFYNNLEFFRVVPGFVAQTGDPKNRGTGGPNWMIREELTLAPQDENWVGMATSGKDTGGSQFFFNVAHNPHLDWHYTAFAKVESGQAVIAQLLPGDVMKSVVRVP